MNHKREPHRNGQPASQSVGEAYAFFNYGGPKENLSQEVLEDIRNRCQLPSALELRVFGDANKKLSKSSELALAAQRDSALQEVIGDSDGTSYSYVIQGRHPGVTNERTACELNDLMNGIHHDLYARGEPIRCDIVYKLKGEDKYDVFSD